MMPEIIGDLKAKLEKSNDALAAYKTNANAWVPTTGPSISTPTSPTTSPPTSPPLSPLFARRYQKTGRVGAGKHGAKGGGVSKTPSFYVDLLHAAVTDHHDHNKRNKQYHKLNLKLLSSEMNADMKQYTLNMIKQLWPQPGAPGSGQSVEDTIVQPLVDRLDDRFGQHWCCILANNNAVSKCVLKYEPDAPEITSPPISPTTNIPPALDSQTPTQTTDPLIHVFKKSANLEPTIEKFIVGVALDALYRHMPLIDDHGSSGGLVGYTMETYQAICVTLRDTICQKYSGQWFVSVGARQHYSTSWAKLRSRKFMLFDVNGVKFTVGEVGTG
ncbi:unnamed protein product, partial [Medioppia subpectinata]